MKAANYQYLEFISSFDDHSGENEKLTKAIDFIMEKGHSYRGLNFFVGRVHDIRNAGERISVSILNISVRQPFPEFSNGSVSMELSKG